MTEDIEWDAPVLDLADETGRTLPCYVENSLETDGEEYVLLYPVDAPIELVWWRGGSDNEEEDPVPVEDDAELDRLFPTAKAVLAEENLVLKRTAIVLTVEGELPAMPEHDEADIDGAAEDMEELQWLATFFYDDCEYGIYTPLDPLFLLARLDADGNPKLLDDAEFERIQDLLPALEEAFFEGLD